MSVSSELLCSFELLKPLDSSALKMHIKKGKMKRNSMTHQSPVCSPTSLPSMQLLKLNSPRDWLHNPTRCTVLCCLFFRLAPNTILISTLLMNLWIVRPYTTAATSGLTNHQQNIQHLSVEGRWEAIGSLIDQFFDVCKWLARVYLILMADLKTREIVLLSHMSGVRD